MELTEQQLTALKQFANSRLLDAAPDLLDACQKAKKFLEPNLVEPGRSIFWKLADAINKATKGNESALLVGGEDRERRMAEQLIRAEKERDIVVGILTQARCYIDSPRFDEEGEFTGMVDDILKKMP